MQTRALITLIICCLFAAGHAAAEETEAQQPASPMRDIDIQADRMEADVTASTFAGSGNVRIVSGDITIFADRAFGWQVRKEVYLEGNIRVRTPEQEYRGEKGFVNWETGEMVFEVFEARSLERAEELSWYVQTPLGLRFADGTIEAEDARISNCDYAIPHQYLRVRQITIKPNNDLIARGITYYVHGIPMPVYVPVVMVPANLPAISFNFGSSSSFGDFAELGLAIKLPFEFVDATAGGKIGYFSKRGIGYGVDGAYRHPYVTRGMLDYFVVPDDRGEDFSDVPLGTTYRYRYKAIHSMDVVDPEDSLRGWELDLEVQKYSDAGFQHEWFQREFYYEKEPENRLYLKGFSENWAAFAEGKIRLNSYLDQTERLPAIGILGFSQPVFAGTLWTSETELGYYRRRLSNIRRRPGETTAQFEARRQRQNAFQILPPITPAEEMGADRLVFRFDTTQEVSRPFSAGFVNVEPFGGVRETFYNKRLADNSSTLRSQAFYGVRIGTLLQRIYDVKSDFWDLDGLRHIIIPEVNYFGATETWGVKPDELIVLDETELARRVDRIELRLENMLQTHRRREIAEWLEVDLEIDYFPNASRDNEGRNFSPLRIDARMRPIDYAYAFAQVEYDVNNDELPFVGAGASLDITERLSVYASQMYEKDFDNFGTYSAGWRMTPKWVAIGTYVRNWKTSETLEERLEFVRDLHCFSLSIEITNDRRDDEQAVSFGIMPKPVGAPPMPRYFVRALPEARDDEE